MRRVVVIAALVAPGCNSLIGIGDVHGAGGIDAAPGAPDAKPGTIDAAPGAPDARFAGPIALAAASDFQHAGVAGALELGTGAITADAVPGAVGRDPVIRYTGGLFVIVNRYGDNGVVLLDPTSLAVQKTIPTGAGTNPQDAAILDGKVFVPTLGSAGVQVYDVAGGGTARLIDLSGFDPDGQPDCVAAYATPSRVFVACDLLDASFTPRGPGKIAVIDPAAESVVSSFDLPWANPFGTFAPTVGGGVGGDLLIETVPSFGDLTKGCIARIKLAGTPAADGCLVTNQALGGYVGSMAVDSVGSTVWAATSSGKLAWITVASGAVSPQSPPTGAAFTNVASCASGDLAATLSGVMGAGGVQLYHQGAAQYPSAKWFGMSPQNVGALACD